MKGLELSWIENQILIISNALKELKTPIPVLFPDHCKKCEKDTTHRSYIGDKPPRQEEYYAAVTGAIEIVNGYAPKNLLKICLSCGERTYLNLKEGDNERY